MIKKCSCGEDEACSAKCDRKTAPFNIRIPKYRIIYVSHANDPCHWQVQERKYFFFWKNLHGNVSSATTAGTLITNMMLVRGI